MNEVRTICELALDEPAPPLRDGAAALAIARRTTARRNRLRVAGSSAVAVAVAGVLATPAVAGWQAAPAPDAGPATETTAAQPAPATTAPAPPPSAHAGPVHGRAMAAVLKAAVPPGHTVTKVDGLSDDKTVYSRKHRLEPGSQLMAAYTQVEIAAGGGEGQLMAVILYDGKKAPSGDLCAPEHAGSKADAALPCEVVTVNGVPVKVTRQHDPEYGEVISAVRFLDGGELMVSSWQGIPSYEPDGNLPPDAVDKQPEGDDHRPPLADPPLSAQQVAELAADPAMLP
ncbi:hypothetical protein ACTMTJ_29290 [Phytohabitans sp. LJ34]|uniref:hypothetical protein n=1 Tax=Phytohabitans sp. LJ34 TaxID=3452217 RepID=UPI003F8BE583